MGILNFKNAVALAAAPFTGGTSLLFAKDNSGNDMFGEITGKNSAKKANEEAKAAAARQMKFQSEMSNTAHQREIRDLKAAGLNPILSAGGSGASTPAGASYTPQNEMPGGLLAQGERFLNTASTVASIKNIAANTQKQQTETGLAAAQTAQTAADTALKTAASPKAEAAAKLYNTWFGRNIVAPANEIFGGGSAGATMAHSATALKAAKAVSKRPSAPIVNYYGK